MLEVRDLRLQPYGLTINDQFRHAPEQQRVLDQISFDEAITLACDFLDATKGQAVTRTQYERLHEGGYVTPSPDEVCRIFYDWEDFQQVAQTYYNDRLEKKALEERTIFEGLLQERELGLIPDILFHDVKRYKIKNPKGGKKLDRFQILPGDAPVNEVIARYYKYMLVPELTSDEGSEISEERRLSIAMGMTINGETGTPLSSFTSSIKNSNARISDEEIEEATIKLDAYDYIFPKSRQLHLSAMVRIAGKDELAQLPPTRSFFDTQNGQLLLGESERGKYLEANPAAKETVKKLGKLLLAAELETKFGRRYQHKGWEKERYIYYGQWLLRVLGPYDRTLSLHILQNAYDLGIGPHPDRIRKDNGSIVEYFQDLSEVEGTHVGSNRRGMFDDWEFEDYVNHLKSVANENDGRVTKKILQDRVDAGAREPDPRMIEKKYKFSDLLEAAGLPKYSKNMSADDCLSAGVRFALENNGKTPSEVDMKRTAYLMSDFLVRKYFGKVSVYRQMVQEKLALLDESNANSSEDKTDIPMAA